MTDDRAVRDWGLTCSYPRTNVAVMKDTTEKHIALRLSQLDRAERKITGYRKMLAIANEYGMEYEQNRIPSQINEGNTDAEAYRDLLIELGYVPS